MHLLIFGFGMIAQREYLPHMRELARRAEPSVELRVQCVDKGRPGCSEVETWESDPAIQPSAVDKILVLSPPHAHFANTSSIAHRYASLGLSLPEIYVEKPIYLQSQIGSWNDLLTEHRGLEESAFYIDHYRFKEPLVWLQAHRSEVLGATGTISEIGFVSLEEQEFWDSQAFDQGYFLEHGCHLVGMLDRVFPGLGEREWSADPTREWKVWEQAGRPPSCHADSASLLHLTVAGDGYPEVAPEVVLTAIVGKGMVDAKVLYLRGEKASAQLWFNEGRLVVTAEGQEPAESDVPSGDSYAAVAESIFYARKKPGLLLSLRQGMAEQEKVIAMRSFFPQEMGVYSVGHMPPEIAAELARMGLESSRRRARA